MSLRREDFASSQNGPRAARQRLMQKLDRWAFPIAELLVPAQKRSEWAQEWRAELWQLQNGSRRARPAHGALSEALSLGYGLIADAGWLRVDWLRASARGSAGWCLTVLSLYCLLSAVTEFTLLGSWHTFLHILGRHFFGCFIFVALPAIFVAMATYPLRPLRCEGQHVGRLRLSARARWNLFLVAKMILTLALGFLTTMMALVPMRAALGRYSDWGELIFSTVVVTVGLRWALLNQEQRCQKCLRLLSQPMRVGRPSYNFLYWSGMEMVCTDGHGLLHVPEMRGSWCWYDRWVEQDPMTLSLQI
ncbi:hypothetical protein [Acidicapsa ligni]|uniref:hypothetical protein n=1 Tax=Acidicapsa ligni TaxID=542300 RepID=UPI0021E08DA8|nr:hypothetical protein [Acidicapsa ligni]